MVLLQKLNIRKGGYKAVVSMCEQKNMILETTCPYMYKTIGYMSGVSVL